jgi:hypothetical protein
VVHANGSICLGGEVSRVLSVMPYMYIYDTIVAWHSEGTGAYGVQYSISNINGHGV